MNIFNDVTKTASDVYNKALERITAFQTHWKGWRSKNPEIWEAQCILTLTKVFTEVCIEYVYLGMGAQQSIPKHCRPVYKTWRATMFNICTLFHFFSKCCSIRTFK